MKVPRDLSGQELIAALCRDWGYRKIHQEGSHITLQTDEPKRQRVVVPAHRTLRVGTLNGILKAVARHKGMTREDLLKTL